MEILTLLIINLIITAFVYLLVPIIVVIREKEYKQSTLWKIATINGVAGWFLFSIISINAGGDGANVSATCLWSYIGYVIMKKRCLAKNDSTASITYSSEALKSKYNKCPKCNTTFTGDKCPFCGNADFEFSLSEQKHVDTPKGNYNVYGRDIALEKPEPELKIVYTEGKKSIGSLQANSAGSKKTKNPPIILVYILEFVIILLLLIIGLFNNKISSLKKEIDSLKTESSSKTNSSSTGKKWKMLEDGTFVPAE